MQRTRLNKRKYENDSEYKNLYDEAQELKKRGIKNVNDIRDYKSAEKQMQDEKSKDYSPVLDTIAEAIANLAPAY